MEIKTQQPYNPYRAREDRKKGLLPHVIPPRINLRGFDKAILIFPVWGYTLALPVQSFLKSHPLRGEVEIITVGVGRLGGMYEDVKKLLPKAKISRFTHIPKVYHLADQQLEAALKNRTQPPSLHGILTRGLDPYQEVINTNIELINTDFAKMLPRSATWCSNPQTRPKPRTSTNPAPDCLSYLKNTLYFNGQPIGRIFFHEELPTEGSEVTISSSDFPKR